MHQLHLCHLGLLFSDTSGEQLESCLLDISCCPTLMPLAILNIDLVVAHGSPRLPSMYLQSMPRLKHVRFVDCLLVYALSLPSDCSLYLDVDRSDYVECREPWEMFCSYTTVLRLRAYDTKWPLGFQGLSKLNFFEYRTERLHYQDLADLQHICHVKLVSLDRDWARGCRKAKLQITGGSWQSLEILFLDGLSLSIRDVDSFINCTRSFTFSSKDIDGAATGLFQDIQEACRRHGKSCHLSAHTGAVCSKQVMYVTLSTSKDVAEHCPFIRGDDHKLGSAIDFDRTLCHLDNFWPCDPCASVKWY